MALDGELRFGTRIDTSGFTRGTNTVRSQANGLRSTFLSLGKVIGLAFAVGQLVKFGKEAVNTASDLQEIQNVVDTAFGSISNKMEEFAKTSIESFGLSELSAKKAGSTFMAMGSGMGITADRASDMAIALTGLSGDMASFFNVSQDVANTALQSIYTGETESLKKFGIVMTEVNLQAFAMSKGINKSVQSMSQAEKVQLRYAFVMSQTALAQGDFAKTSGSWANQTRVLTERWKQFLGIMGKGLINVLTPVVKYLNIVMSQLIAFAETASGIITSVFGDASTTAKGTTNAISDMGDATTGVATDTEGVTKGIEATADATKEATKEAEKGVFAFDELNTAQKPDTAIDEPSVGDIDIPDLSQATAVTSKALDSVNELKKAMSVLLDRARELKDTFIDGFLSGLGDFKPRIDNIKDSFESIGTSLFNIATDSEVSKAFDGLLDSWSFALGQFAGSIASIGITIAQNLLGGIAMWLDSDKGAIKQSLISIFNIQSEIAELVGNMWETIASVFEVFGSENGQRITASLVGVFGNTFLFLSELVSSLARDLLTVIMQPFIDNKELLRTTLNDSLGVIATVLETIKTTLDETFKSFLTMYNEHIKPFFDSITAGLSELLTVMLNVFNTHILPVLQQLAEKFDTVFKEHIQPMLEQFIILIGKVFDLLKVLWENLLQPLLKFLIEKFGKDFGETLKTIGNIMLDVLATASDVFGGIFTILGGLIDFITGVFSGDWEKAWDGIVQIFSGIGKIISAIVNVILGVMESLVNGVIGGINLCISALNGLKFTVPNWVPVIGGGSFGLSIPKIPTAKIPRLATGTVVPPTSGEFAAILGDNKRETEVVSPLSTMKKAFKEALAESGSGGSGGNTTINMQVDGKTFAQIVLPYINGENSRKGATLVKVGV